MRIKLGVPYLLSGIASATKGILNSYDSEITHITTDTRETLKGDLFVGIDGGGNHLDNAKERGAFTLSKDKSSDIAVEDPGASLLHFASTYIQNLPYILYKIGITGSVGKTTTKEFLKIILQERYRVHANEGNYNNEIGMPMSILSAPWDTQVIISEMGMNHAGEIKRLSNCLCPDLAIITNIGSSHIGNLGSREAIAEAKLEILSGMKGGRIFVPFGEKLLKKGNGEITVSVNNDGADYNLKARGVTVSLCHRNSVLLTSNFRLQENHHLISLAFSASVGAYLGLTKEELEIGSSHISTDNTRQRAVCKEKYSFLLDCYNSSYESVAALCNTAKHIRHSGEKSLVLGDILELGQYANVIHYEVGKIVGCMEFSNIFLLGEYSKQVKDGAKKSGFPEEKIFLNEDVMRPDITAKQIKEKCSEGGLIFMKASHAIRLERILDFFD